MNRMARWVGMQLGRWLSRRVHVHAIPPSVSLARFADGLRPADVLLVEGDTRVSTAIKYLTQSTWSHTALYVGATVDQPSRPECIAEVLHLRHHSLFVPRDFDLSPNFEVVKPGLGSVFDFHVL